MKMITAPETFTGEGFPTLFLGGGISNCPDWQADMAMFLQHTDLVLFNPRRRTWDINDDAVQSEQIRWEFDLLSRANIILFWFPKETLCPITLFELGAWSNSWKPVVVGCHPEYARRLDVEVQLSLRRPEIVVASSLHELAEQAKSASLCILP